jgi:predicted DNA binding CopG/RHH family protein
MAKAMEEGCTLTMKQVLERHGIDASEITVQVAPEDIARARAQAARGGLRYEEYIRQVLHQALVTNDAGSQG